jgi:hypothetical protein
MSRRGFPVGGAEDCVRSETEISAVPVFSAVGPSYDGSNPAGDA